MGLESLPERGVVDISLLLTLHDEAEQAQPSLLAASRACERAGQQGLDAELVLALDRASAPTQRVVAAFAGARACRVLDLDLGDVGASRNAAIGACRGRNVAICDGDDLLSANFLEVGARMLDSDSRQVIVRPQLVVQFDQSAGVGVQVASDDPAFDPHCLLVVNPWTTGCMARRTLFHTTPYWARSEDGRGYGFEDWKWNCDTLAAGAVNVIAPRTVHYVRIKASGSMNVRYSSEAALVPPSQFFEVL